VLRSDRLSIGPRIRAFEAAMAQQAHRKHAIGVNSGTSGLHLCVRGLGIGPGDEVITTPFSFIATTNCLLFEEATPVFVDIDPGSYNLDPDAIEAAITPKTKAILPVEVFGNTAHFDRYEQIARKHNIKLIEDCCEALGGRLGDRPAGSFGDCGVFGFYPNKQMTTGEGGIVVTDDDRLAELCVSMRNQGRATGRANVYDRLGYNYRMTELSAALGEAQVRRLDEILSQRRAVAACYNRALAEIDEIHLPPSDDPAFHSWFVYVIRLGDRFDGKDRDLLMRALRQEGIETARYFPAIHLQPYIKRTLGTSEGDYPICEHISDRTVALPFFTSMTPEQVDQIAEALKRCLVRVKKEQVV
jgi:perosamine synthetase